MELICLGLRFRKKKLPLKTSFSCRFHQDHHSEMLRDPSISHEVLIISPQQKVGCQKKLGAVVVQKFFIDFFTGKWNKKK